MFRKTSGHEQAGRPFCSVKYKFDPNANHTILPPHASAGSWLFQKARRQLSDADVAPAATIDSPSEGRSQDDKQAVAVEA